MKKIIVFVGILLFAAAYITLYKPYQNAKSACMMMQLEDANIHKISTTVDSMWAQTHRVIAQSLPADIDTLLRIRLTTLKQVKYITSYQYFNEMTPALQSLIRTTGVKDSMYAYQMRMLMNEQTQQQQMLLTATQALHKVPFGNNLIQQLDCVK